MNSISDAKNKAVTAFTTQLDDSIKEKVVQRNQINSNKKKTKVPFSWLESYTKRLMTLIIIIALIDMQLTYVLAWKGYVQIAESLSSTIAQVIVGTTTGYLAKSLFETMSAELVKLFRDVKGIPDANPPKGDLVNAVNDEPPVTMTEEDEFG